MTPAGEQRREHFTTWTIPHVFLQPNDNNTAVPLHLRAEIHPGSISPLERRERREVETWLTCSQSVGGSGNRCSRWSRDRVWKNRKSEISFIVYSLNYVHLKCNQDYKHWMLPQCHHSAVSHPPFVYESVWGGWQRFLIYYLNEATGVWSLQLSE